MPEISLVSNQIQETNILFAMILLSMLKMVLWCLLPSKVPAYIVIKLIIA